MNDYQKMYMIGACAWLLSDYLGQVPQNDVLKKLFESRRQYKALGQLSISMLDVCRLSEHAGQYIDSMEAKGVVGEAMQQFAQSADMLNSWLSAMFQVGNHNMVNFGDEVSMSCLKYAKNPFALDSGLDAEIRKAFAEALARNPSTSYASYEAGAKDLFDILVKRLQS